MALWDDILRFFPDDPLGGEGLKMLESCILDRINPKNESAIASLGFEDVGGISLPSTTPRDGPREASTLFLKKSDLALEERIFKMSKNEQKIPYF